MNKSYRDISNKEFKINVMIVLHGIFFLLFSAFSTIIVLTSENLSSFVQITLISLLGIISLSLFNKANNGLKKQNTQPSPREEEELNQQEVKNGRTNKS